jgi:hypothetical protein
MNPMVPDSESDRLQRFSHLHEQSIKYEKVTQLPTQRLAMQQETEKYQAALSAISLESSSFQLTLDTGAEKQTRWSQRCNRQLELLQIPTKEDSWEGSRRYI